MINPFIQLAKILKKKERLSILAIFLYRDFEPLLINRPILNEKELIHGKRYT